MEDFDRPFAAVLGDDDVDRVIFALETCNLEEVAEGTPNEWTEKAFNALAKALAGQQEEKRIVTALSMEAAALIRTALFDYATKAESDGAPKSVKFATAISNIFGDAILAHNGDADQTREMPIQPPTVRSADPLARIAHSFERIADSTEVIAAEVVRRGEEVGP